MRASQSIERRIGVVLLFTGTLAACGNSPNGAAEASDAGSSSGAASAVSAGSGASTSGSFSGGSSGDGQSRDSGSSPTGSSGSVGPSDGGEAGAPPDRDGGSSPRGSSGSAGSDVGPSDGGEESSSAPDRPCDIFAGQGNACVAAHSTIRALRKAYNGNLYQVRRSSDNTTMNIGLTGAGGFASTAVQESFCAGTACVITVVYDQSGKGNDLWYQGSAMVPGSPSSSPASATTESLSVGGNKVYSLYIKPGNSYWVDASKSGIALGAEPEGIYMVTSGTHFNGGCCFDYGNSETDRKADGAGAMDAVNFGSVMSWGTGAGTGPWVMADLEYGLFSEGNGGKNSNDPSMGNKYVTAMLKNDGTSKFALKGANAQSGNLTTFYDGALPGGWSPMKKQGAIVLGSGGDCCKPSGGANDSDGTFYEGAIVTGYPSDTTDALIQSNIVAAAYGQ